eukprot:COSAG02_NODE_12652_length_1514_cov_0.985159_2_plen_164_part_00
MGKKSKKRRAYARAVARGTVVVAAEQSADDAAAVQRAELVLARQAHAQELAQAGSPAKAMPALPAVAPVVTRNRAERWATWRVTAQHLSEVTEAREMLARAELRASAFEEAERSGVAAFDGGAVAEVEADGGEVEDAAETESDEPLRLNLPTDYYSRPCSLLR